MRRIGLVISVAVLLAGCAAGRAFRDGQEAVRSGDWDAAVAYFTKAVQEDPDQAEYKIQLERAKGEAARVHNTRAHDLEDKDQLDAALAEYRKALEMMGTDRIAAAKVAELEKKIRQRIEATRPRPQIEQLRQQARAIGAPPMINPGPREPVKVNFNNASLKDILNAIGQLSGINITYEPTFQDRAYTVNLEGVSLEEALNQILSANADYYKVMNPKTIMIIPDQPQMHAKYDDMVVRVFYLSHADATEVARTLAKPQLRGTEGQKLTLNLGQDIPVIQTVFGAAAAGGFATIPQSSYSYRTVGVNLEMTPRVTYEGEIVLVMSIENSALGQNIDVAGQSVPSFTSRKVTTTLRLREGEANLLAGLIRQDNVHNLSGLPGLIHLPLLKQLFANNDNTDQDTDIVMLITPHIVRTHDLTAEDLGSIYIGTQQNVGLSGPPPLIAPQPEAPPGTAPAPVPGAVPPAPAPGNVQAPNTPPPGVPQPPVAGEPGAQPLNRPAPPGTSPVPTPITPVAPGAVQPFPPPPGMPPIATPPGTPPAGAPPVTPEPVAPAPVAPPRSPPGTPPAPGTTPTTPATPAQISVFPPGTEFRVAGGPYTVPVSINNASRVSVITLTITYNPNVLRVRTVQDGTFMRQGGGTAWFTPKIDAAAGRVDIAIARAGDQIGASGTGLLAALLFDAVAPGGSIITVAGVANAPDGSAV